MRVTNKIVYSAVIPSATLSCNRYLEAQDARVDKNLPSKN